MIYDLTEIRSAGRDDDGTIATNSVQISTQPANGSVMKLPDDTGSYVPGIGFAGTVGVNGHLPLLGIYKFADNRNHSATIIVYMFLGFVHLEKNQFPTYLFLKLNNH